MFEALGGSVASVVRSSQPYKAANYNKNQNNFKIILHIYISIFLVKNVSAARFYNVISALGRNNLVQYG